MSSFAIPQTAAHQASLSLKLSPWVCSNSCLLSQLSYLNILSSAVLFFFPQSFPKSQSIPMSWFFATGGQIIKATAPHQSFLPYSGLISFKLDWFNFLDVQGTLKSLLQHHSLKTSVLRCSTYIMVQLHISAWLLERCEIICTQIWY